MSVTGRPNWLITWDTLADQAAKARGEYTAFRFFRARTIIYLSALVVAAGVMVAALTHRAELGLSVLRDRAPLFVPLADGTLRNGYTLKIANKEDTQVLFEVSVQGLPGAVLTEADEGLGPPISSVCRWALIASARSA